MSRVKVIVNGVEIIVETELDRTPERDENPRRDPPTPDPRKRQDSDPDCHAPWAR